MKLPALLSALALPRRSLLIQLLGVYLLFVALVLGIDFQVDAAARQQVISQVQTTDLALAQEIGLDTDSQVGGAELALTQLSRLSAVRQGDPGAMMSAFQAFKAARNDIDLVYWLGADGTLEASFPSNFRTLGSNIRALGTDVGSQQAFEQAFQQARNEQGTPRPVLEDGIVDLTTYAAVAALALPVRDPGGRLLGVLATNLKLDDLNQSFQPVIAAQRQQHQHLVISIVDAQGRLIGTVQQRERLLQPALGELPGAAAALRGRVATRQGTDTQGRRWLYSALPIRHLGWAVVIQRSEDDALAVISNFRRWIGIAAGLFALGGLLFWLVLLFRVVRPLHVLARRHTRLPLAGAPVAESLPLVKRADEVGGLARSLNRLEDDVVTQLAELHTLLETSSAVVTSLDPIAVGRTIIDEVRRLVDIQAAAVFVPDEEGVLRVLVSEGRDEWHDEASTVRLDDPTRPAALALREGRPVQMVAGESDSYPPLSYAAGFRALLAMPIISRHAGGVVLVVHRTQARRFSDQEVELLLTFANYATLAWEHAVLYERSDERLREIARENERLYREAMAEKQTLAAIMGSMSDGLILTGVDGRVLYTNPGASEIIGLSREVLGESHIDRIHQTLRGLAQDPVDYDRMLARIGAGERPSWMLETETGGRYRAIGLRLFDVRDETTEAIGYGLLLRDVTRERELDQFKTTLLGAVGHELRTPLSAIKGYASTLLQRDVTWSPSEQQHFLQTISSEADHLAQLVTNILDLSRSEAGLLPLHRASSSLETLVDSAVRRLQNPVPDLVLDLPSTLPAIDVDRARVEVVLHNLLTNALAYGNGRVEISAEQQDSVIVVHISDDGPGIDDDELPHIFERFYRARAGSRRRSAGTGLGLAISRAFVEAHGGAVWAESTGRGTIISFSLPVSSLNGDGRPVAPGAQTPALAHGSSGGTP